MSNTKESAVMVLKGLQSYSESCFWDPVPCQLASKHHWSVCQGMWCLLQSDVCVCVCVCVVSVIVKHPVLPPSVVDGRSRNPLYYYYYYDVATDWFRFKTVMTFSSQKHGCQILFTEKALLTVRSWGQMLGKMYHLRVQELWYCIQNPGPSLLCPVPSTPHHWPNSKHWFATSFLQPLPYLVTPQVPENCQLTSSFLLVLKQ